MPNKVATVQKSSPVTVAASAAFGGIAPSLISLAIGLRSGGKGLPAGVQWTTYLLALLVFAALAAAVAYIWQETDLKKAFYLGLGLPSLINVIGSSVQAGETSPGEDAGASRSAFVLIAEAYAQQPDLNVAGRTLRILPSGKFPASYTVVFSSRNGRRTERRELDPSRGDEAVTVPNDAAHFSIAVGNSMSGRQPLPEAPNANTRVRVTVTSRAWGGFLKALGGRNVAEYTIQVTPR